ncbi:MAG: methyltransferase domain-containing protein [Verrucomicrobia bacterium]|nr:methyltransferase domain-containing protein [Verrucomicrobiota bacterium]
MRQREFDPSVREQMDEVGTLTPELARDLDALAGINRHFGGQAVWAHFAARWIRPGARLRLLDLATGGGDGPRFFVQYARKVQAEVRVVAVDFQGPTLAYAAARSADFPEIEWREGDILRFEPEASESFDLALCSLALHHFSEKDAVQILERVGRLGTRGALVTDLERGYVCTVGAWLLTALLYRDPMTKHDARMSARRAFSAPELRALAQRAGWTQARHRSFAFARQAVWLEP